MTITQVDKSDKTSIEKIYKKNKTNYFYQQKA